MAEQLGEAVLTVSADTRQLEAGLQRAQQQAQQSGQALQAAFAGGAQGPASSIRSIQALQQRLQSLRASYETVQIGSKGFRDLQREIQKTEQELQKVDKTLGATFAQRAGGFGQGLLGGLGIGVGLGAGAAVGGFIKDSIQQAIELETVTRKLSNTLGAQGAGAALAFTKSLANDLGLNFKDLAGSFGSFTAAATSANVPLETQKNLFAAVAKSGQALGLGNDEINGSFIALQQVASKGTVAMEELRGQLGERLPIALSATAKGLGISQQELIKLVESGKLTAGQFFPALTKGLNELTSGAGGVPTAAQNFAKLGNAWQDLQASFGKNLLPGLTGGVKVLTEAIKGLGAAARANALKDNLKLGGNDAATLSGSLDFLQQKYNVNDANAQELLRKAIKGSGATTDIFGTLTFTGEQFAQVQLRINDLFEEFRKKYPDVVAAASAKAAADAKAADAAKKAAEATQKQLDVDLKRNQAALQLRTLQEKLGVARMQPSLDDFGNTAMQNRLALNEKIRAVQADQLALTRELSKPVGTGDGKNGVQDASKILDLQNKIKTGEVEITLQRVQNQQTEVTAFRRRREQQQTLALELRALGQGAGAVISPTALLQVKLANMDVRDAYASAGLSLVQNARSAADALKSAQQSFDNTARGGFQFLTTEQQQKQLLAARIQVQKGLDAGLIRSGVDISTPEKLFQLAGLSDSLVNGQKALQDAFKENASATNALAKKDWNVYVSAGGSLPQQQPPQPQVVGTINGTPIRA
jgi:tape measure domain-containing protein